MGGVRYVDLSNRYSGKRFIEGLLRKYRSYLIEKTYVTYMPPQIKKYVSGEGESLGEFRRRVMEALNVEAGLDKLKSKYMDRIVKLEERIRRKEMQIKVLQTDIEQLKKQLTLVGATAIISVIARRPRISSITQSERIRERIRVKEAKIEKHKNEIKTLKMQKELTLKRASEEAEKIRRKTERYLSGIRMIKLKANRRNIEITKYQLLWIPLQR